MLKFIYNDTCYFCTLSENYRRKRYSKMKKKQGFTLIELLAVVVILAVIALISVPLIMNVIDGARKGALQNTAYGIAEAGKYTFTNEVIKDGSASFTAYIYENGVETSSPTGKTLNYKGEKPKTGTILINSKGDIAMSIYNGKYCAEKGFDDVEVIVNEKAEVDCVLVEELTEVEVLVVAGGGAGGSNYAEAGTGTTGGGGGAGGLIYNGTYSVVAGTPIDVVVGAGGISPMVIAPAGNGENSSFGTLIAIGGGGGACRTCEPSVGGSGGGAGYFKKVGALGTAGQGYSGGSNVDNTFGGSGGGGSKEVGYNSLDNSGVAGGDGLYYGDKFGNTLGQNGYFAAGGGGGGRTGYIGGLGGNGGGGTGGAGSNATNGLPNTGSGGGGSGSTGFEGGNGGSGIVIVRYFGAQRANGGSVTVVGDYTVHTFTSGTATFTPSDL